jgi:N,N'-diacetylbacillosaminyl-diphospho-undecaprenol alpha-1,3-N-acetylgalactosaminyltransferase
MKRIVYISNSAKGELTGRARWWDGLKKEGFEVTFILPENEARYIENIKSIGIEVIGWNLKRSRRNILNKSLAILMLMKILKKEKFDLVHSFAHESNIYTDVASCLTGQKYVINTVTGLGSAFVEPSLVGKIITMLYMMCEPKVSMYTFENEEDCEYFSFVPKKKREVIYGAGVDTEFYSKEQVDIDKLDAIREQMVIEPSDLVVTYIGRLLKFKGINELVEAWDSLDIERGHLLLVGETDEESPSSFTREEISELGRKKNVRFLGRREDVRELLAISDIFINPSAYREGIPRTNLEAMSMGTPIITTNNVGCRYTVEDGRNGILVDMNDSRALAIAIETLARSRDLREQMGAESRRIARDKFSLNYVVKEYAKLYRTVLI